MVECDNPVSRLVATGRALSVLPVAPQNVFLDVGCRDLSRHVATGRDRSHLFDVRDVLRDRGFGDQILLSELRFDPATTEMTFGAISLNASGCSRMAGVFVPGGGFSERRTMKT